MSTIFLENNNTRTTPPHSVCSERRLITKDHPALTYLEIRHFSPLLTTLIILMTPLFTCLCKTPDSSFSLRFSSSFSPYCNRVNRINSLISLCICLSHSTLCIVTYIPFIIICSWFLVVGRHSLLTQRKSMFFLIIDTQTQVYKYTYRAYSCNSVTSASGHK